MMKPSDQAKLLFLYLLRSSAAMATRATTTTTSTTSITTTTSTSSAVKQVVSLPPPSVVPNPNVSSTTSSSATGSMGHINLRIATRSDVPSIQRCNLASLPENYSSNFYVNHIRSFPDLALVAEHVPPAAKTTNKKKGGRNINSKNNGRRNPFESYNPSVPEAQIIGYVLGKIEHPVQNLQPSKITTGNDELDDYLQHTNSQQPTTAPEILGHVTSLAVLKPYRRRGLAALLMKQLHFHMKYGHSALSVGLHVRVSNVAARRLYCEGMGYGVVDVIRGYYADGEDAFFMRKDLTVEPKNVAEREYSKMVQQQKHEEEQQQQQSRKPWLLIRKNKVHQDAEAVHENGPLEFRLPMIIPLDEDESATSSNAAVNVNGNKSKDTNVPGMVDDSPEEEDARVMTGSL